MGVNSLPMTVTRQRRGCDLNPGPSAAESSILTTRIPSHPSAKLDTHNHFPVLSTEAGLTIGCAKLSHWISQNAPNVMWLTVQTIHTGRWRIFLKTRKRLQVSYKLARLLNWTVDTALFHTCRTVASSFAGITPLSTEVGQTRCWRILKLNNNNKIDIIRPRRLENAAGC